MKKTFARILFWDDPSQRTPAAQMACDEALAGVAEGPVLRAYRWQGQGSPRFDQFPLRMVKPDYRVRLQSD